VKHRIWSAAATVMAASALAFAAWPAGSASAVPAQSGTYGVRSQLNDTSCLDVYHSGTTDYTNVDLWGCNHTPAQKWTLIPVGSTSQGTVYQLVSGVNTNTPMCLDDYHSGTSNYNNVDIFHCYSSGGQLNSAQLWVWDGESFHSGVDLNDCLDVYHSGTANGTNVDIFGCNGSYAQRWALSAP
jgi:hypothetical protein